MRIEAAMLVLLAANASAYECEETAKIAAQMAVSAHEPAGSPDDFGLTEIVWQRALRTIVWLNARYDDGREQTRWCVAVVLDPKCRKATKLFDDAGKPTVKRVLPCPVEPADEKLERMVRALGWK